MKRKLIALASLLLAATSIGVGYRIKSAERITREAERAKVLHEAALADSQDITSGIQSYFEYVNSRARLQNDQIRLSNDRLEAQIAVLEGKRPNHSRMGRDAAIARNDQDRVDLTTTVGVHPALDPYQAEGRIQEHNRKYPFDPIASTADINKEMERVNSKLKAVMEDTDAKLRAQ